MRTIKFRGKRVDNGEWVFGYYASINGEAFILVPKDNIHGFILVSVIPKTVGLFIGVKDKNDVEIYFGDKLRFSDKWEWYRGEWFWKLMNKVDDEYKALIKEYDALPFEERVVEDIRDYEWLLSSEIQTYWEVIGNIHEGGNNVS